MHQSTTNNAADRYRLLAWWQLLRIGNIFTAVSNVAAGVLIVRQTWQPLAPLIALAAASAFLYAAGMVLNDAFDADLDFRERPERPIPSGRISKAKAYRVGFGLLMLGVGCSMVASWQLQTRACAAVGVLLAVTIVSYDAWWKKTEFGPSVMGVCRYLNVLLGASIATDLLAEPVAWIYAAVVGMYTIGLTLFARAENEKTNTQGQSLGGLLTLAALGFMGGLPWVVSDYFGVQSILPIWYGCLAMFGLVVTFSLLHATWNPGPSAFRQHVTKLLLGFVFLDALAVAFVVGWSSGLIILTLIIPSWVASRWAPMT